MKHQSEKVKLRLPRYQIESAETKKNNIAGQVLTYNSKNFHLLNRKTRPRMDYE